MTNSPHPAPEPTQCPRCGKAFACSPSGKCWCYSVFVPPDKLNQLTDTYASCLCPDCLSEIATQQPDEKP